jgi:5'-nucleotidase
MPRRHLARIVALICAALLGALPLVAAAAPGRQSGPATLRIVHTNDHHGHLDPLLVDGVQLGGVSRRVTLVNSLRAESAARQEPMLLLDAGDVFEGTPFFERYQGQADLGFYNMLGYDALAVGNHEFDRGDGPLAAFADGARFPLLSANMRVAAPSPLVGKVRPWTVVERGGLRVGIFGLTTPHTSWLSAVGPGVSFTNPQAAAERAVGELQGQGVTVIVALVHLGMGDEVKLLKQVPGIDVMIGGHSHSRLASNGAAYPRLVAQVDGGQAVYATAWQFGLIVGDLELQLDAEGRVTGASGREVPVDAAIAPDPAAEAQLAALRQGLRP